MINEETFPRKLAVSEQQKLFVQIICYLYISFAIIRDNMEFWVDMWDHWNKVLHDKVNTLLSEQLQSEIVEEFAAGSASVTQDAKILFRPGMEAILAGSEAMRMAWLLQI